MLLGLIMIIVAFEIEHVFVELILGLSYLCLLTYYIFVSLLLHFFILVAIIVASCLLAMLFPVSQAQPAEFMRT
jgi:hypothetical protein